MWQHSDRPRARASQTRAVEHPNTLGWEYWLCWRVLEAAGWDAGSQIEHGGSDLGVRLRHIWFLFFSHEGPAKVFYQGRGETEAEVLRVTLQSSVCVKEDWEGKEVGRCGDPSSEAVGTIQV